MLYMFRHKYFHTFLHHQALEVTDDIIQKALWLRAHEQCTLCAAAQLIFIEVFLVQTTHIALIKSFIIKCSRPGFVSDRHRVQITRWQSQLHDATADS